MSEGEGKTVVVTAPENITDARKMLAELTKKYLAGEISANMYRAACYGTNSLTKCMTAEKAAELERRVIALEKLRAGK